MYVILRVWLELPSFNNGVLSLDWLRIDVVVPNECNGFLNFQFSGKSCDFQEPIVI